MHQNTAPMSESCVKSAYRLARAASGVNPGSTNAHAASQLCHPPPWRKASRCANQHLSRSRIPRHHRHLHPSDQRQRGPHPSSPGQTPPSPQVLKLRPLIPLAEVLRRHWPAYERKYRTRLCLRRTAPPSPPSSPAGTPHWAVNSTVRLRPGSTMPITPAITVPVPSAVTPMPPVARTSAPQAPARPLLPGHLHRAGSVAPSHPLPPEGPLPMLLRESAAALREVARDHKDLGAQIGLVAVSKPGRATCAIIPRPLRRARRRPLPGSPALGQPQARRLLPAAVRPGPALAHRLKRPCSSSSSVIPPNPRLAWSLNWVVDVQPSAPANRPSSIWRLTSIAPPQRRADLRGRCSRHYLHLQGQ